jgi:predicted AAA+ superfamily ATPase
MSWEGFIIDQLISIFQQSEPGSQPYFWRTAQGHEIDLLIDLGAKKIPFEIKLHSAPTATDAAVLRQCLQQLNLPQGYLIHSGRQNYSLGGGITALAAEDLLARPQASRVACAACSGQRCRMSAAVALARQQRAH